MEVRATAKYLRVQPRKVRILADEVRGTSALRAAALLKFHSSKGARLLHKVLASAIANAEANNGLNAENLKISTIRVDEGPRLKRMQARAMGRGNRIIKKTSHITVVLEDYEPQAAVRPHGTKAKPRPTFNAPKKKGGKKTEAVAAQETVAESVEPTETVTSSAEPEVVEAPVEETPAPEADVAGAEAPATEEASSDDEKGDK
jgi:large subunit ribosomal protein L22